MTTSDVDFDGFYAAHSLALVRLGVLLTGDRGAAEDIAQDALVAVYRRWDRFETPGDALAYARVTVVNATRNVHRHRGVVARTMLRIAGREATGDHAGHVVDRDLVGSAIAALPTRQREVVVLRYWLDLSEAEIARILQISPGTVKSAASRALHTLAATIREEER